MPPTPDPTAKLYAAIDKFQRECPTIFKASENPFFNARYAALDSVKAVIDPVLRNNGLMIVQPTRVTDAGDNVLVTMLIHLESGLHLDSEYKLTAIKGNDPQSQGSALTYARRYQYLAILNLVSEDDDANAAARPPEPPREPQADESVTEVDWQAKVEEATTAVGLRAAANEAWTHYKGHLPKSLKDAIDAKLAGFEQAAAKS